MHNDDVSVPQGVSATDRWVALFDTCPWLDGLSAAGSCGDVFCCPAVDVDRDVLDDVQDLLRQLTGFPYANVLRRDLVHLPHPSEVAG